MDGRMRWRSVLRDESGSMTIYAMLMFVTCAIIGGLALDFARMHKTITEMQNAADSAAHAAIISRPDLGEGEAKAMAVEIALRNMPAALNGAVMTAADVVFGDWDPETATFHPRAGATDAVRVSVSRTVALGNPFRMTLLRLAGMETADIRREATMVAADQDCLREGFVSQTYVDMQSNNQYLRGFCIHSNGGVKISSNNFFETGVVVTMPRPAGIDLPQSGFASNPGLEEALAQNRYTIRILNRLQEIIAGLTTPGSPYVPRYITNTTPVVLNRRNVGGTPLPEGRVYQVTCNGGQRLTVDNGAVLNNVVIVTNCEVTFGNGAVMQNAVIATTNTGARSINGPNGVQVGRNDNCGTGGGAQMITLGGMDFAAGLQVYGGQLLAAGGIAFTADAGGIEGASFVAGGTITGSSNMTFEGCGGAGMEDNFAVPYAQMVF